MIVDGHMSFKKIKTYIFDLKDFKDEFERYELHLEFADYCCADLYLYHTKQKCKMKLCSVAYYKDDEDEVVYNVVQKLLKDKEKTIANIEENIEFYQKHYAR